MQEIEVADLTLKVLEPHEDDELTNLITAEYERRLLSWHNIITRTNIGNIPADEIFLAALDFENRLELYTPQDVLKLLQAYLSGLKQIYDKDQYFEIPYLRAKVLLAGFIVVEEDMFDRKMAGDDMPGVAELIQQGYEKIETNLTQAVSDFKKFLEHNPDLVLAAYSTSISADYALFHTRKAFYEAKCHEDPTRSREMFVEDQDAAQTILEKLFVDGLFRSVHHACVTVVNYALVFKLIGSREAAERGRLYLEGVRKHLGDIPEIREEINYFNIEFPQN